MRHHSNVISPLWLFCYIVKIEEGLTFDKAEVAIHNIYYGHKISLPKNPSHNRKVHLFSSPTVQPCIEIRASTLIYWSLADRPTHMCCGTNLEAATTARQREVHLPVVEKLLWLIYMEKHYDDTVKQLTVNKLHIS
jgi:hypothetical protein